MLLPRSDDYAALGFKLQNKRSRSAAIPGMADTSCQSCLAGIGLLHRLGLTEYKLKRCSNKADIIPVTMMMHSTTQVGIKILGATVLRLHATSDAGSQMDTRKIVYITDATDQLFLSLSGVRPHQRYIPVSWRTLH